MFRAVDHIVVVVPELEAAIRSYAELGFTVVRGGRHNIGTHNALVAFADRCRVARSRVTKALRLLG